MVTAEELVAFGTANGLVVHPARDPVQWAADINQNDGMCLCDPVRMCPCPEAVSDISSATKPENQCCICRFYVSAAYIDHYYPDGVPITDPEPSDNVSHPTPATSRQVDPEVVAVADQIVGGIDAALTKFDSGEYDEAFDVLGNLSEELECAACQESVVVEAINVSNTRNICDYSTAACNAEKARVRQRLVDLRQTYADVGGTSDTPIPPKKGGARQQSPYHDRMGKCLTSDEMNSVADPRMADKKLKFCSCAKLSSNKAKDVDEAIEQCTIGVGL